MAKIVRPAKEKFQPYQIVIDIDTHEKAFIYKQIFGSQNTIAQTIYNAMPQEWDDEDISQTDISETIGAEFNYDEWKSLA